MIKNLLFDFGNVLFKINHELSIIEFKKISNKKIDMGKMNILIDEYESGLYSSEIFIGNLRRELDIVTDDSAIINAWNALLIEPFDYSMDIINELKREYNISLLSNTNEIHFEHFYKSSAKFLDLMDNLFLSHKIGARKPKNEIYRFVLDNSNYIPQETLFIDDLEENLIAAEKLGFCTFHINSENDLRQLKKYLSDLKSDNH